MKIFFGLRKSCLLTYIGGFDKMYMVCIHEDSSENREYIGECILAVSLYFPYYVYFKWR